MAPQLGNVSEACRQIGVARSTYYAWKPRLERYGRDGLRVRERRRARMPHQIGPHLAHRILAFSLGHPGFGPRRISAELSRPKWGGIRVSENGVWRVLGRFKLNTRSKRLALIARHADPYERKPNQTPAELHIEATEPGEKVQMVCVYVGRLSGSKGVVWQYTAIDVASAYTWAFLRSTERNPSARHTAELVHWSLASSTRRRVLLGSVSAALMRAAPCPVMVVPRTAEFQPTGDGMAAEDEFVASS